MQNVVIISSDDNVGVVINEIKKGDKLHTTNSEGKEISFESKDDIRIYHKVAIKEIIKGEHVVKYGEHIGLAGRDIKLGEHVHTHNVLEQREDLSLVE